MDFQPLPTITRIVLADAQDQEITESQMDKELVAGKHVVIKNAWYRIMTRDRKADKVGLDMAPMSIADGFKGAKHIDMKYSSLVKNLKSGQYGARIGMSFVGKPQDRMKRDDQRKGKGLPAAPGMAKYRNKE